MSDSGYLRNGHADDEWTAAERESGVVPHDDDSTVDGRSAVEDADDKRFDEIGNVGTGSASTFAQDGKLPRPYMIPARFPDKTTAIGAVGEQDSTTTDAGEAGIGLARSRAGTAKAKQERIGAGQSADGCSAPDLPRSGPLHVNDHEWRNRFQNVRQPGRGQRSSVRGGRAREGTSGVSHTGTSSSIAHTRGLFGALGEEEC